MAQTPASGPAHDAPPAAPDHPAPRPPRVHGPALQRHLAPQPQAWLHGEIARRMAERIGYIRQPPVRILDWGAPTSASAQALATQCPKAELVALDDQGRAVPASSERRWWQPWRARAAATAPVPVAPGDLLWSNMQLHWVEDLPPLLARWQAAVAVNGYLLFSCFGPDTLRELRALYAQASWGLPCSEWPDMHDLGDALVHAGFADPVMDMEQLTLTWDSPAALLAELRTLGRNTHPQRHAGLRTPRWRQRLEAALAERLSGTDGRLHLRFEIVYGHAFRVATRKAGHGGEARFTLDELRASARAPSHKGQAEGGV